MDLLKTGKCIREHRDKLGLSQKDLSEKVHVTRQAVSNWENGKTLPDSDVLLCLSDLFHVTINDILCGESMEETVLELVDETNKKTHSIKKMMLVFTGILSFLLVSFLALYFVTNYNSIKVYKAYSSSEHFRVQDGMIISTSTNTYFKLGKIDIKNNESLSIDRIKLYYEKGNKKETIFENDVTDRLYVDRSGYEELYRKKFEKYKNYLYLEIRYNNQKTEIMKLQIKKEYSNSLMMMIDERNIIKNNNPKELQDKIDNFIKEEEIQFERDFQVRKDVMPINLTQLTQKTSNAENIVQENKKEDVSNNSQEVEPPKTDPIVPEQPDEPVQEDTVQEDSNENLFMDYAEVIEIINTYGETIGKIKQLEYDVNDKHVTIRVLKNTITIDAVNNNILESITVKVGNSIIIMYHKYDNNIEQEQYNDNLESLIENNPEIVKIINNYLRLVYQENE